MKTFTIVVAVITALNLPAAFSPSFAADEPAAWAKVREACKQDRDKFCGAETADGGRRGCLRSHLAELSQPCADALKTAEAAREALRGACGPDMDKFCADQKGHGRLMVQCLKQHTAELAPACADLLKAHNPS